MRHLNRHGFTCAQWARCATTKLKILTSMALWTSNTSNCPETGALDYNWIRT